jgi:hypothetical protein
LREAGHDISPTRVAAEFNARAHGSTVTIHGARKWLRGESIPTQERVRILAAWLGTTASILRFGPGDLERIDAELSGPQQEAFRIAREAKQLSVKNQLLVSSIIELLLKVQGQELTLVSMKDDKAFI